MKSKDTNQLIEELTKLNIFWVDTDGTEWNIGNNLDAVEKIEKALTQVATHKEQEVLEIIKGKKRYPNSYPKSSLAFYFKGQHDLIDELLQSLTTKEK